MGIWSSRDGRVSEEVRWQIPARVWSGKLDGAMPTPKIGRLNPHSRRDVGFTSREFQKGWGAPPPAGLPGWQARSPSPLRGKGLQTPSPDVPYVLPCSG